MSAVAAKPKPRFPMRDRIFTNTSFINWMKEHDLTERGAADWLGCSPSTVRSFKVRGAPFYIKLACAAIDHKIVDVATADMDGVTP